MVKGDVINLSVFTGLNNLGRAEAHFDVYKTLNKVVYRLCVGYKVLNTVSGNIFAVRPSDNAFSLRVLLFG